jgi:hypothetical protein
LPAPKRHNIGEVSNVRAKLARFTTAIALLAMTALSLGAGMRWWD